MKHTTLLTFTKLLIVFGLLGTFSLSNFTSIVHPAVAQAGNEVENWWPVDGVKLEGSQPFKALVNNLDIKNYSMYWQVDGGQLNKMDDNYTDYPHKEALVDLSGWNWKNNAPYNITFVAKDQSDNTISEKSLSIYVNSEGIVTSVKSESQNTNAAPAVSAPAEVIATFPTLPTITPAPTPVPTVVPTPVIVVPSEKVFFPVNNSTIDGIQPFRAVIENLPITSYTMYWQVDGDRLNEMQTVNDYKESLVDVTNWSWNTSNKYTLTFVAKDLNGKEIARQNSVFFKDSAKNTIVAPTVPKVIEKPLPTPTPKPTPKPTPAPTPVIALPSLTTSSSGNILEGIQFYVNPSSNAVKQVEAWKKSQPQYAELMMKIASEPDAKWIGNWNTNVYQDVKDYVTNATKQGGTPVMVAYNIPGRDCGSYSAGGAANAANYETWIKNFANGIGNNKAVVILEPDALAGITCLDQAGQTSRLTLLKDAVKTFKSKGNVVVYIDAGNSNWVSADEMAPRLKSAGIEEADGFALNVSNYYRTEDNVNFGTRLSALVGGKHFIIDTSRNGQGPLGSEWCNPQGRGLGHPATTNTGNSLVDAFMWLKNPGESDGTCNGGPSAGVWWPDYALGLAEKAEF